jgi:hypothetical protein
VNADLDLQLAHQRGIQAAIWGMPAVSLACLREATFRDLGARCNDVVFLSAPALPRHELLTPSDEAPLVTVMLDLRKGPMVLEVPPAVEGRGLSGCVVDAWMLPLVDLGIGGEDEGRGARYLFLPPGFDGSVKGNFVPVSSTTFDLQARLRPAARSAGVAELIEQVKRIRAHAYSSDRSAPASRYIDAHPKVWRTLPNYGIGFFERLASIVDGEPWQEKDAAMIGMLATLGIRKDAPFLPAGRLVRALEQAVTDARRQMEHYFETPGLGTTPYRPDGHWVVGNRTPHDGATFMVNGKLLLDERAGGYSYWTRFAPKRPRLGLYLLRALRDASGSLLKGRSLYRLRVPRDVPASDHWSLLAYDKETKAFFHNDLDRVGFSSRERPELRANRDGSIDLWFGPEAPHGLASNWIPTGGDFFVAFRLYGPDKTVLDRWFRMPDLEKVD